MGGMEFNKIFAALLVAGIVASLSGFFAKELTATESHGEHEFAYPIKGASGSAGAGPAKVDLPDPILGMIAGADPVHGQKLTKACAACHSFEKGGPNGTGPNLWNVMNRGIGTHEGFSYSDTVGSHGGKWTYAMLNKFLWKPKKTMEGTKMNFIGLKKPEDRAAVIAYLRTLEDNPPPLPTDAEIAAEQAELVPAEEAAEEAVDDMTEDAAEGHMEH